MSVGRAHTAIRGMLRLPRPGRPWPRWLWIASLVFPLAPLAKAVGRLWTWVLLTVTFSLVLGIVPLFGVLGFELALAASLFAAVLGLDVGSAVARERLRAGTLDSPVTSTLAAVAVVGALLVVPAVFSAVRGIWLPTCDWWFGIKAYLVMPILTGALAAAVGHSIGVVAGPRRFLGAVLAQALLVALALTALYRFYAAPPVFTYNPILGYFPGNLYDENVKLTAALAWSRLEQVLWVIAVVAAVAVKVDRRRLAAFAIAVICAAGAIGLHTQSGRLGYAIDAEDIEEALGGRIETPHFIIHYADTKDIREVIGLVAADHEFRYAQVTSQLGVQSAGKIRSFYFSDRDQKEQWMGARDVEMAKPWRREIYLDHRSFPHSSLRHEIAHAVAAEFGDPLFGVATRRVLGLPLLASPGLIEGLAVAIDWPGRYDRLTPHESVRALQEMGMRPSIARLLSLQFFSVSSATGYTTAGSFLRFLLDTYGAPPLRAVYRNGGDFAAAYGKPLAVLERDWLAMTQAIVLPKDAVEASRERFRGTSVFARPCPHAVAASREHVQEAIEHGDRKRAIALMRGVCGDAPEEPRYRLELADLLADGSPAERLQAMALWTALTLDPDRVTSTLRAEALEKLARVAARRNDFAEVRRLIAQALTLPVDADDRRQLEALSFALAHQGPAGAALRGYFYATDTGISPPTWALLATLAEPDLGFGHYLLGLQRFARGDLAASTQSLERGLTLGLPAIAFVKNAGRRLAVAAYRANDPAGVRVAITALSGRDMATADRLLAQDWADRLAFDAQPKR